ncbi:MAG: Pr6Pr family membrane protein, partial [bacterium]|nr:Pr6Pr family membrane protein [bacterium]
MPDDLANPTVSRAGRTAFGLTALIAAFGLVLNVVITALGTYPATQTNATIYGYDNPDGLAGAVSRTLDFLSYFTILSNVVVVIVLVALWRGRIGPTPVWRALRMDSLLMITVTGLIFVIVLRPEAHLEGLQYITNTTEHYITPVLTVVT